MKFIRRTILTMRRGKSWTLLFALGLLIACAAAAPNPVRAQPLVPATFYGAVVVDGSTVPDGTEVIAYIDGRDCTQRGNFFRGTAESDGVSQYSIEVLHESQREGCGRDGAEIQFEVGGHPADQVGEWRSGPQRLDLTLRLAEGASLPTPASSSPPSEEPREDTVDAVDPTPVPDRGGSVDNRPASAGTFAQGQESNGTAPTSTGTNEDANDGGVAVWLIAIVVVVIVIGVVAGWIVAGRRHLS